MQFCKDWVAHNKTQQNGIIQAEANSSPASRTSASVLIGFEYSVRTLAFFMPSKSPLGGCGVPLQ